MFYESHLGNLAFGKQSLAQLMLEPQAQAGRAPAGAAATDSGTAAGARAATENATPNAATVRAGDAGPQAGMAASPAAAQNASVLLASGMDPQTPLLVRQPLEVLANPTFAWRGEARPNRSEKPRGGTEV